MQMELAMNKILPALGADGKSAVLVACGSFNPPTYMHLRMFELARDHLRSLSYRVLGGYISPVNDLYAKQGLAPSAHRIKMCELATADSSFVMVDPWEANQSSAQRTRDVLHRAKTALEKSGKSVQVMLLCGADVLQSFEVPNVWVPSQVEEICSIHGIVCVARPGTELEEVVSRNEILRKYQNNVIVITEDVVGNMSSTRIRNKISRGLSVKYLTWDSVIECISANKLYANLP